ncbi:MAG: lipopolysaccharide kinase InaA family protein [Bacillota bacterium]
MKLNKQRYNNKINIYYYKQLPTQLCQEVIDYFRLKQSYPSLKLTKVSARSGIEVFRFNYKEESYYLKYYQHSRLSKKLQTMIRQPEGIRNFKTALKLLAAGIRTAQPVLALTKRNGLTYDSIFITKAAPGIQLNDYLEQQDVDRKKLLLTLGQVGAKFVNHNFAHQDPTLDNFFIVSSHDQLKLSLIDLDDIYAMIYLPKFAAAHVISRFVAKFYLNKGNRMDLFKAGGLELFLEEFINHYQYRLNREKLLIKIKRLIIKKIIKRNSQESIRSNRTLTKLYHKYWS